MMKALAAAALALLISAPMPWTSAQAVQIPEDMTIDVDSLTGGKDALLCLAMNDYWEARGESLQGRVAVAHVVLNRVADSRYPDTVCDVVHQHLVPDVAHACQFSWTCDGRSDTPTNETSWRRSLQLAAAMLEGDSAIDDPTGGALWYHAATVRPTWVAQLVEANVIGAHTFYREPALPPLPLPRPAEVLVAVLDDAEARDDAPFGASPAGLSDGVLVAVNLRRWSNGMNGWLEQVAAVH